MYTIIIGLQIIGFYIIYLTMSKVELNLWEKLLYGVGTLGIGFLGTSFLGIWGACLLGVYFVMISSFKARKLEVWEVFSALYSLVMNSLLGNLVWDGGMFLVALLFRNITASPEYFGYLLTALAPPALNWLIVSVIRKWLKKRNLAGAAKIGNAFYIVAVLVLIGIVAMLYPILAYGNEAGEITGFQNLMIDRLWIGIGLVLFVYAYLYVRSVNRHIKGVREQQIEDLLQYSAHMEQLYDEIRGFRHDYANLLTTLEHGIYQGDMAEVRQVYEHVMKPVGENLSHRRFSYGKLGNIKIVELKSLLSAKFIIAEQQDIQVHFEAEQPVVNSYMDLIVLVRVLAVLLDNAIEYGAKITDKNIYAAVYENSRELVFDVRNPLEDKVDLGKMKKKNFSTKGAGRGFGLYQVQQLLHKQRNVMLSTEQEDSLMIQKLVIAKPVDEQQEGA